jgi:hypothetical protein
MKVDQQEDTENPAEFKIVLDCDMVIWNSETQKSKLQSNKTLIPS